VNRKNPLGSKGRVYNAYRRLLQQMRHSYGTASASEVKLAVAGCNPTFEDFGQHDSAEFLISLLDGLHEDLNHSDVAKGLVLPSDLEERSGMDLHSVCNRSKIVKLFHGETMTVFNYPCGKREEIHEPLAQWALSLPAQIGLLTLEECIEAWRKPQILDGDNAFYCDDCDGLENCQRTIEVVRFAPILIIQLKRFEQMGSRLKKSTKIVSYPIEFDSKYFCAEASGKYELTGVSRHAGSLSGGHYTALIRHPGEDQWYSISDSSVSRSRKLTGGRISDASAMVLVYQRRT
jgi:ubiquitin carboxyl-terminal hydrolase 8